ncbi:MAG: cytochrome c oxidase subunit 3 [Porticoccaceae bacterium]
MAAATPSQLAEKSKKHLPGEAGVWVFIVGDMLVFALFFATFVYYRAQAVELYIQSQGTLNQGFGVINTFLMLSSSWFVALAVQAARANSSKLSPTFFALAFLCGGGFIAVKFFEYGEKIRAGIGLTTNDFYMYYYMFTGIHLLHVVIGMAVLGFLWHVSRKGASDGENMVMLETGASFWHLVDVLWIVLFALLYLMK